VMSAQFSADGTTVLTASKDDTARLWDAASGKELQVLRGHETGVKSAQFSADGKTVLTASWDQTARLWDAASGNELRALRGHEGPVMSAQFSADGKTVLTASDDHTARLWACPECRPIGEVVDAVASRVGRQLSEDERLRFGLPLREAAQ
jgi:WD40 repeat protein